MALTSGTRLGPYEILAPIGAGGMGEVYKAKDTRLDRTVAIKVLPEHLAESPERKARFEREAKAISQLNHPHICTLYDVGEQDGIDFIVMEYIEGETLAERLKKGALPLDEALEYGIQIADGLDTAHRAGIVHRDLKPGNTMLTKSGIKLLDFGLAKVLGEEAEPGASDAPTRQRDLTKERHYRNASVHGSRAAGGQDGGRTNGPLRLRCPVVRDALREESVRGREPGELDWRHLERRAASCLGTSSAVVVAPRSDDRKVSGQSPRS